MHACTMYYRSINYFLVQLSSSDLTFPLLHGGIDTIGYSVFTLISRKDRQLLSSLFQAFDMLLWTFCYCYKLGPQSNRVSIYRYVFEDDLLTLLTIPLTLR